MKNLYKSIGIGILAFAGAILLFGIPTALIPTSWFARMVSAQTMDYVFLLLNSTLIGAYFGLHTYERRERNNRSDRLATTGGIMNIFAVGCPLCNKGFIVLLGASATMAYFEPLRVWLGLLSVAVIGVAVWFKIKNVRACVSCRKEVVQA